MNSTSISERAKFRSRGREEIRSGRAIIDASWLSSSARPSVQFFPKPVPQHKTLKRWSTTEEVTPSRQCYSLY